MRTAVLSFCLLCSMNLFGNTISSNAPYVLPEIDFDLLLDSNQIAFSPIFNIDPIVDQMMGDEKGNGGDAVVCRNDGGEIESIELFDFYEARVIRQIDYDLGGPELSLDEKMRLALNRIVELSPRRAQRYYDQYKSFFSESIIIPGISLIDIDNTYHHAFPSNCSLEQVIIQERPILDGDPRYIINGDLWNKLDDDNKVGFILHELIYREAFHHPHSRYVRYFNSYIFGNKFESFTKNEFIEFVQTMKLLYVDIQGALVDLTKPVEYYSDGSLKKAHVISRSLYIHEDHPWKVIGSITFHPNNDLAATYLADPGFLDFQGDEIAISGQINFGSDGSSRTFYIASPISYAVGEKEFLIHGFFNDAEDQYREVYLNPGQEISFPNQNIVFTINVENRVRFCVYPYSYRWYNLEFYDFQKVQVRDQEIWVNTINFFENGNVASIFFKGLVSYEVAGQTVWFTGGIEWDQSGNLIAGGLAKHATLKCAEGLCDFNAGDDVYFDENGIAVK